MSLQIATQEPTDSRNDPMLLKISPHEDPEELEDWIDSNTGFFIEFNSPLSLLDSAPPFHLVTHHELAYLASSSPSPSSTSAQSDPNIPRSAKAAVREAKLSTIHQFLSTMERPLGMSDKEYCQFIRQAMDYYVVDRRLYQKGRDGSAQLIPDPHDRLRLIQYAHDSLGHKGIFPTARNLLMCFWWPHLNEDI